MPRENEKEISLLEEEIIEAILNGSNIKEIVKQKTLLIIVKYLNDIENLKIFTKVIICTVIKGVQSQQNKAAMQTEVARARISEAIDGLDEAFAQVALAIKLAMSEAAGQSKAINIAEYIKLRKNLVALENAFIQSLLFSKSTAKAAVREILHDLITHIRIHGSVVEQQVREALDVIAHQISSVGCAEIELGLGIADSTSDVLRQIMAGALSGLADYITPVRKHGKDD